MCTSILDLFIHKQSIILIYTQDLRTKWRHNLHLLEVVSVEYAMPHLILSTYWDSSISCLNVTLCSIYWWHLMWRGRNYVKQLYLCIFDIPSAWLNHCCLQLSLTCEKWDIMINDNVEGIIIKPMTYMGSWQAKSVCSLNMVCLVSSDWWFLWDFKKLSTAAKLICLSMLVKVSRI